MRIISLTASNIKRLKAVHIEPDGTLQVITGRNAQGKTSVLDAIWLALGGGPAARETSKPIRDGEDTATVTLDLGDLVVTRTWKAGSTTLDVRSQDGAKYTSPQTMLDALVGRLSFDPLAFTRLSPREQVTALLDLVDIDVDLDELAAQRASLYEKRTELGRQTKAYGDVPRVNAALSTTEVSAASLIEQIRAAQELERANAATESKRQQAADHVADIETQRARLNREYDDAKAAFLVVDAEWQACVEPASTETLEVKLGDVEQTNAAIRANNAARDTAAKVAALDKDYQAHTKQIDALDAKRDTALATAKFPVAGLGFTDDGVTYQGVPFSQASSAEQIKVSLAMAMALNPKLRVIRILDGSLLDTESMTTIAELAATHDYQVWVERVSDASGVGVVIEDGEVA